MFGTRQEQQEAWTGRKVKPNLSKEQKAKEASDKEKAQKAQQNSEVEEKVKKSGEEREKGYQKGRARSEELFNRDVQGLTPEKKNAMQYEANRNIHRNMETANRKLLGEQGRHGIVGRGGVGYAQQRDLQRMGREEEGQVVRDIDKLDSDLAMKNLAAMFNIEQGEASQSQLDRQLAIDELQLADERKRQREFEEKFYRQFSRI